MDLLTWRRLVDWGGRGSVRRDFWRSCRYCRAPATRHQHHQSHPDDSRQTQCGTGHLKQAHSDPRYTSRKIRKFWTDKLLSVRNFQIFLLMYPGSQPGQHSRHAAVGLYDVMCHVSWVQWMDTEGERQIIIKNMFIMEVILHTCCTPILIFYAASEKLLFFIILVWAFWMDLIVRRSFRFGLCPHGTTGRDDMQGWGRWGILVVFFLPYLHFLCILDLLLFIFKCTCITFHCLLTLSDDIKEQNVYGLCIYLCLGRIYLLYIYAYIYVSFFAPRICRISRNRDLVPGIVSNLYRLGNSKERSSLGFWGITVKGMRSYHSFF